MGAVPGDAFTPGEGAKTGFESAARAHHGGGGGRGVDVPVLLHVVGVSMGDEGHGARVMRVEPQVVLG